jgi:hypothetical protein
MEIREIDHTDRRIAAHKVRIIRQQEIAAQLVRAGEAERARQARAKLFAMLNQLDLMEQGSPRSEP